MSTNNQPVITLNAFPLQVSIFKNSNQTNIWYTTIISRSYKDSDGKWHRTTQMREQDLLPYTQLLQQAWNKIQTMKHRDYMNRQPENSPEDPRVAERQAIEQGTWNEADFNDNVPF